MELPLIFVNFKTYEEASGNKGLTLAKICESASKEYSATIAISPQFADILRIASEVEIPVFAQHIDPVESGAYTGHISALSVKEAGASGTLINHSEKKLKLEEIEKCVEIAKKTNLISICCSENAEESKQIAKFDPDFIAHEPPELIGTGMSVSKEKPIIVSEIVALVKELNPRTSVLCGAGISVPEDLKTAIELGTSGVLLSSAFVKSKDPKKFLEEFCRTLTGI